MANVAFTRDEVILALDTFLFSDKKHFSRNSPAVIELSQLLNALPIHPMEKRPPNFRNPVGISDQISAFRRSLKTNGKEKHLGSAFFQIYDEYKDAIEKIHIIAKAIRRNIDFFTNSTFGAIGETYDFPEGALLSHLHRMLEIRDSKKISAAPVCEVCHLDLSQVYKEVPGGFMQLHLTVEITELDYNTEYKPGDFITVCPNCHAMLHQYRPWLTKKTANEILY